MATAGEIAVDAYKRQKGAPLTSAEENRIFSEISKLGNCNERSATLLGFLQHISDSVNSAPNLIKEAVDYSARKAAAQATVEVEKKLADAVHLAAIESAEGAAKKVAFETLGIWIIGAIIVSVLAVGAVTALIHKRAYDSGYLKGFAEARNEELILKQRDQFWASDLGKYAQHLYDEGKLKPLLEISALYNSETLTSILTCKRKGWEIKKHNGRDVCFHAKTGFYMPDEIIDK